MNNSTDNNCANGNGVSNDSVRTNDVNGSSASNNSDFIMLPTVDFCFKELMQNAKVRKGFIAALLNISPEEIGETTLLPTIFDKEHADDKIGILDVHVLLRDGRQIDMEMQVAAFEYWEKRALFYLGKMYVKQIKSGEPYENLKKCIHVSVLDFVHIPGDSRFYRTINLRDEETGDLYSDLFELKILELPKVPPDIKTGEGIVRWMQFFNAKSRKEFADMAKTDEYLDEAYQALLKMSADERKQLEYEAREKALKDYNSQMLSAERRGQRKGLEQGLERGEKRGKTYTLVTLVCRKLKKNCSISEIADMLEEPEDVIQPICDTARAFAPDYDVDKIVEILYKKSSEK